jgi:hypothetical protein
MNLRTKLESMQASGTLVDACERLIEECKLGTGWANISVLQQALRAFDPSPIEKAREALKVSGFVNIQAGDPNDPKLIQIITVGARELWRESST